MKLPCAFSPAVMAVLARPAATYDPRDAEIIPGVIPKWYVVKVYPGAERKVADELIARRFGIFIPESEKTVVRRGRKVDRVELMFPGYIFVFVWDVLQHRSRIECVPGVTGLIYDDGKPAVITDDKIDIIRAVENGERPLVKETTNGKRGRRRRKRAAVDMEIVSVKPWSAFADDLIALDSQGRNQSLMRALGLCS
ncbi:transcription termination/antitermination protein NusG [Mesorhizobium sp.]|uniref:transcription termination/antitermination protein NusG n=1 Tax=Mesorhizobium sp. TaxID=1871066 RepID=UPI0025F1963A|nr:transcription termination/antitermination NusG family protein [Mesorhizobium sp.]